uniref:Queuosine 5'-phosphate N-glycosylase/hydrolase n=1 Tax=Ditylenchus dipsaci TaxID=166011 RepID=A0A915DHH2_9BILA
MLLDSVLNPRESGIFIAENSHEIQIDELAIKNVALMIHKAVKSGEISESDFESYDMHTKAGAQQAVEWIFFVDLINFSFWMDDGSCFAVSYTAKDGTTSQYSGYFAACACVNRALDKAFR